jgi:hypothetical protein
MWFAEDRNAQQYYAFLLAFSAMHRPLDLAGDVESTIAARCEGAAKLRNLCRVGIAQSFDSK